MKISARLQEHMCRLGAKLTFEESAEELNTFMAIEANAKQVERLCHHYGEVLESIDWRGCYNDSIQLKFKLEDPLYVMMDGSMILTREKEHSWKEVKLCRMFLGSDRVTGISKDRSMLSDSLYIGHLGSHQQFLDKVLDSMPSKPCKVFLGDGAKWIWNWVDEYFPGSTQILDYYHCKEHLYEFGKEYFRTHQQSHAWAEQCMDKLKAEQVEAVISEIEQLPTKKKQLEKSRNNLVTYLKNNEKRVNYGKFIKQGYMVGSGAIESANRDVIQKRLKLSGQRWTMEGAKQMLNIRTCYKTAGMKILKNLITNAA